jgi:hypothetical protein
VGGGCENCRVSSADTVHFRYSQAIWVAAVIAFIGGLPLASAGWFLSPILLLPLALAIWGWRAGTDADPRELRLRALVGQRRIPWSDVAEFSVDGRDRVIVLLADGRTARLPAVRAADLPDLVAASGQPLLDQPAQ